MAAKLEIPSGTFELEINAGKTAPAMKAAEATTPAGYYLVPPANIRRIPGFNARIATPDYEAHVAEIADSIRENGFYRNKPLGGYVGEEDGENVIFLTDGYSRLKAVELLIEQGVEIDKVPVFLKPSSDNIIDLTVALDRDNQGRPLTIFERAIVVKRLTGFNVETGEIARRLGITDRYVTDLIVLAGAPPKVRNLVITGKVSATEAIKQLRKDSGKATERLTNAVKTAEAEGKDKASAKHVEAAEEGETEHHKVSTKVSKGKQVDEAVWRFKGGDKVRKGSITDILTLAGGDWWREAEDLDDADEDDVIVTRPLSIRIVVTQDPQESAETDEETDAQNGGDHGGGDADEGATEEESGEGEQEANGGL